MFIFYDTETTGIDKNFTQILQMDLVFTDADLNILSSKKVECGNSPWVLPSPGALLTNGFTPDYLKSAKVTNFEMMQDVYSWVKSQHWPLTFAGYNSIAYDEPVFAQNLFQSLLPADLTTKDSPANGQLNGRIDIMLMVQATALYMPGALNLKVKNYYGLPSSTLKAVAQQNGVPLSDDDAHDAGNDNKATVGVARVIKKAAPQIWDQMLSLSTLAGVENFLVDNTIFTYANAEHYDPVAKKQYPMSASVMTSLAEVPGTIDQTLFDLRVDPAPYLDMSVNELKDVILSTERQKPIAIISKGSQPILMPMELSDAVAEKADDAAVFEARAKKLRANKPFLEKVAKAAALAQQETKPAADEPEMQIESKMSAAVLAKVTAWCHEFRNAEDWAARAALVRGFRTHFADELEKDASLMRFGSFANRLVFEHAPEELTEHQQTAMKKAIAARLLNPDPNVPWVTIAKARKELSTIEWHRREKHDKWAEVDDADIRRLKLYCTAIEKEYAPYSPYKTEAANNNTAQAGSKKSGFNGKSPKP